MRPEHLRAVYHINRHSGPLRLKIVAQGVTVDPEGGRGGKPGLLAVGAPVVLYDDQYGSLEALDDAVAEWEERLRLAFGDVPIMVLML